jgi:hypothetical protein
MLKNAKKSKKLGIGIRNTSLHDPPIDKLAAEVGKYIMY